MCFFVPISVDRLAGLEATQSLPRHPLLAGLEATQSLRRHPLAVQRARKSRRHQVRSLPRMRTTLARTRTRSRRAAVARFGSVGGRMRRKRPRTRLRHGKGTPWQKSWQWLWRPWLVKMSVARFGYVDGRTMLMDRQRWGGNGIWHRSWQRLWRSLLMTMVRPRTKCLHILW